MDARAWKQFTGVYPWELEIINFYTVLIFLITKYLLQWCNKYVSVIKKSENFCPKGNLQKA